MNRIENQKQFEVEAEARKAKKQFNSMLYITSRQVSLVAASIILLSFFIFIAGYFLGQRKALEQFTQSVEQDAFADHIYSNMYALYDMQQAHGQQVTPEQPSAPDERTKLAHKTTPEQKPVNKHYYAQLIGFGTSRAAARFVERVQQKNMSVKVKERHSKTAQGKKIIWYQVVSDSFSSKDDLMAFVVKIKKEERLKDIRIVTC